MKKILMALAIGTTCLASGAVMACDKPAQPEIPDAATVVTAQMVKANNEMKAYVKGVEDYVKCAKLSRSEEKKEMDELKKVADDFNVVVRAFKARAAS